MPANTKTLIEKIAPLPAERIAEIEDFVDFIRLRRAGAGADPCCRRSGHSGLCRHLEQS